MSAATTTTTTTSTTPTKAPRFDGLVFSRYVASCWIVAYHFYGQLNVGDPQPQTAGVKLSDGDERLVLRVFSWGTMWTQYFFFLSGFVLAVARLKSAKPDELKPTWLFLAERLTTTYPLYFLSLVIMVFNRLPDLYYATRADWINLGLHVGLLQAWWPQMVCASSVEQKLFSREFDTGLFHWNVPAWFMSALAFYWILFKPLYRVLRKIPDNLLWVVFCGLWMTSWTAALDMKIRNLPPSRVHHDFYRYNPLMSLHIFAAGMVFARLYAKAPSFLASPAYFFFVTLACSTSVRELTGMKNRHEPYETGLFYFLHNGGLMPVHALIVSGLCTKDPLSAFFARLATIGNISYAQYILQAVVFRLVGISYHIARTTNPRYFASRPYGTPSFQLVLPGTLFFLSFAAHYGFSVPVAAHLRKKLVVAPPPPSSKYGATDLAAAAAASSKV
ncbi:hypothetical protein CTAYLR_007187 [Chrysophaeum taylorii]|uniref:Acyltransferase 3 domain-containing protein n=1 Tax=Chrysophaeum taylorii TaxID=2483200 RepID=A0AAD7XNP3_9STRA|nr:hypothetical protein CTAYLR_007187 [Chrysophaeum taylorii]